MHYSLADNSFGDERRVPVEELESARPIRVLELEISSAESRPDAQGSSSLHLQSELQIFRRSDVPTFCDSDVQI